MDGEESVEDGGQTLSPRPRPDHEAGMTAVAAVSECVPFEPGEVTNTPITAFVAEPGEETAATEPSDTPDAGDTPSDELGSNLPGSVTPVEEHRENADDENREIEEAQKDDEGKQTVQEGGDLPGSVTPGEHRGNGDVENGDTEEAQDDGGKQTANEEGDGRGKKTVALAPSPIEVEDSVSEETRSPPSGAASPAQGQAQGQAQRYRLLGSIRPKPIVAQQTGQTELPAPMPQYTDLTAGAREVHATGPTGAFSTTSERAWHPTPSPSDEDLRQFVLATGGGYGAVDADSRFVVGGEWRDPKPKRTKWFSLRRMPSLRRKAEGGAETSKSGDTSRRDCKSEGPEPGKLGDPSMRGSGVGDESVQSLEEASKEWTAETGKAQQTKKRQEPRFYRPELGSAGYSQKFGFLNDAELEEKRKYSGRRLEGDLLVTLDKIDNVTGDMACLRVVLKLGPESKVNFDAGTSRIYGKRLQSFDRRTRSKVEVEVIVIHEGEDGEMTEGKISGQLWGVMENVREDACDLAFSEGSTVSIALSGKEIRKQEDALPQFAELLDTEVELALYLAKDRASEGIAVVPPMQATLDDILYQDTWMVHQADFAIGKRGLGAGVGKAQYQARRMCYDQATIYELLGYDAIQNPACGRLAWKERDNVEPASYVRIPAEGLPGWEETNPFLIRFLMERVWNMPKPRLVFSVTGGAKDFNMTNNKKDRLLLGLIEAAKAMDAWVITSGTSEGVMKLVGEARARYAVSVPLIGVTTWGTIGGRHKLLNKSRENTVGRQHAQLTPVDDYASGVKEHRSRFRLKPQEHQRRWHRERLLERDDTRPLLRADSSMSNGRVIPLSPDGKRGNTFPNNRALSPLSEGIQLPNTPSSGGGDTARGEDRHVLLMRQRSTQSLVQAAKGWTELDQNHSHFVMVQDGTSGLYAREVKFRGLLESCLAEADGRTNEILAALKRLGMGWQGIDMSDERSSTQPTPAVCVCVQGGPGTVSTVMHAVLNETPVLLVKGSGNAADLIADAVLLRFGHENSRQLSVLTDNQRALSALISGYVRQGSSLSGLCKDYSGLIDHLEHPNESLALNVQAIVARYFEKIPNQGLCLMMSKVLRAAQTGMCWIYDLNAEDGGSSDFSGSLLKCLLHGQRQKRRDDTRQQLERDLQMVIGWNRKDILEQVLEQAVARTTVKEMQDATSMALHGALLSNRVELVKVLLNHGAALNQYSVQEDKVMQHDESAKEMVDEEEMAEQLQAIGRWIELLRVHKDDAASGHIHAVLMPLKLSSQSDWIQMPLFSRAIFKIFPRKPTYKQTYRQLMLAGRAMKQQFHVSKIDIPLEAGVTRKRTWNRAKKFLLKMRWLYRDLLGEGFRYHIGCSNPHLDLLLWSVIMNRQELALLFWNAHARNSMQAALTCALLYRKMAARAEVEPVIQKRMIESSREFEKHAVGVQQAAMEADMLQALEAVEFPLDLWSTGATAVDLAVAGGSMTFLELCCREALDRRFAGDLHPYGQQIGWIRGGCKRAALFCIFSGGLLAPFLIKFVPPPLAENLRYSTQCRTMPIGYPYEPLQNRTISRIFRRYKEGKKLSRAEMKAVSWVLEMGSTAHSREWKLGGDQLGELWDPTFGYWEKIICFWRAPVTIYLSNVVVQVVVLVLFTQFLAASSEVMYDAWDAFEFFLAFFFAASTITESLQILLDGFGSYIEDFWNCIDVTAILCFWTSLYFRNKCMTPGECAFLNDNKWMTTPYQLVSDSEDLSQRIADGQIKVHANGTPMLVMNGISKLFYALSLFFLWTRLLRILSVDKTLGPLVLIFRRMGRDALNFGIMWAVLFIAFSVAVVGTGVAQGGECEQSDYEGECWDAWWIIRTYFQAFSQPFFEDMTNYSSMIFLMFSWVVMNIIMVNLLIARMSSTYSRIEKQSEKEWMLDRYLATNEYMRHTTSIPIPFNVLPLLIDLAFFFLKQIKDWFTAAKEQGWDEYTQSPSSWTSRLTQHLSRTKRRPPSSTMVKELREQRDKIQNLIHSKYKSAGGKHIKLASWNDDGSDEGDNDDVPDPHLLEFHRLSRLITLEETALMRENKQRLRINAFMESARADYRKKSHIEISSQSRIDRVEEGMHAILGLLDVVNNGGVDSYGGYGMGNTASGNSELENINSAVRFTQSMNMHHGFI